MNCEFIPFITSFEYLSNELIYEIFDYLDFYDVHKSFLNLNIRFYNLVNSSTFPIKINLSSISKLMFQLYYKHIIIPYQNRITLLQLSNHFIADLFSVQYNNMIQLRTLILRNIESKFLNNILTDLVCLPSLSSLVIKPIDTHPNGNDLYRQIFRLPVLKYCNVTFNEAIFSESLPIATDKEVSPIEIFLINHDCRIDQLNAFLSYVPQVRRVSCHILSKLSNHQIPIRSIELKNLTHLSLTMKDLTFDQIRLLIEKLFNYLQVFHITTNYSLSYSDINQWERMILPYLLNLRIFHVKLLSDQPKYLFWFNRQWYFEAFSHSFYSIQSIKYHWLHEELFPATNINNYYSVNHISIHNEIEMTRNLIYFPNVTKLTIFPYSNRTYHSLSTILDRIIPLIQLAELVINYPKFCIGKLVELLYYSPNIRTLILHSISFNKITSQLIQQSQTFETVSKKNRITNITIAESYTWEHMKLLCNLCSQLQRLTIARSRLFFGGYMDIVQFLFHDHNHNTRHLSSLCFTNTDPFICRRLSSEYASTYVSVKSIEKNLYVWW
ncbi:unnamed protein product [Adineta steineri]|uniref:F-box domain-containing protein n=1 Tax=Adineta steineri TaxID=433720 RepID=A0A819YC98_9BILA|nr:unnamed protein product [Adineta steineri]CAF4147597.1 unnamed protein product [Adineta steineri]